MPTCETCRWWMNWPRGFFKNNRGLCRHRTVMGPRKATFWCDEHQPNHPKENTDATSD